MRPLLPLRRRRGPGRDARGRPGHHRPRTTIAERYEWAVRVADLQAGFVPRIRVALLGQEPLIHPERFGEIVAARRGAVARTFTDEDGALRWLVGGTAVA
jgi:hypothetical protein